MSEVKPEPWEVWHARFNYDGGTGYKYRPVIVVDVRDDGSLVMMVTSAANKLSLAHDYPIKNWRAAGLRQPSIARADRIAEIPAGYLGSAGRIGVLSEEDVVAITAIVRSLARDGEQG